MSSPIDRRDETCVQPLHHLVRHLVGLVLQPLDRLHAVLGALGLSREELVQVPRSLVLRLATSRNRSKNSSSRGRNETSVAPADDLVGLRRAEDTPSLQVRPRVAPAIFGVFSVPCAASDQPTATICRQRRHHGNI